MFVQECLFLFGFIVSEFLYVDVEKIKITQSNSFVDNFLKLVIIKVCILLVVVLFCMVFHFL
jgi:hypothetical protein